MVKKTVKREAEVDRKMKKVGTLSADAIFVTPLTRRVGRVLEAQDERKEDGARVQLRNPDEDKTLHSQVLVEAVV